VEIKANILKQASDSSLNFKLSVSKAKTFEDCKAKYKFSYIEKLPKKDWDFHVFGKFLHAILEEFHLQLMQAPNSDFAELMTEAFKKAKEEYKETIKIDQLREAKTIISGYLQKIYGEKEVGTLPNVIGVEKGFNIEIGDKLLLNGFIDRIQIDHDGVLHVADYKTTKDKKYLKDFFQLLTYAFALMLEDESLKRVRTSFILLRHNFDSLEKEFTRDEVMPVAKKFVEYAEKIEQEKLWRPSPSFLCKYCDFTEHCSAGKSFLVKKGVIEAPKFGFESW
jgi:RecB family exonuclease